jgi:hypothetical protein
MASVVSKLYGRSDLALDNLTLADCLFARLKPNFRLAPLSPQGSVLTYKYLNKNLRYNGCWASGKIFRLREAHRLVGDGMALFGFREAKVAGDTYRAH